VQDLEEMIQETQRKLTGRAAQLNAIKDMSAQHDTELKLLNHSNEVLEKDHKAIKVNYDKVSRSLNSQLKTKEEMFLKLNKL
jgi:hypothetical protein